MVPRNSIAIVPLMDMLNHSFTAAARGVLNTVTGHYNIITDVGFRKNEEIFICYGNMTKYVLI